MKKRITAVISLLITLIFIATPIFGCKNSEDKQKDKFKAYFTDVYTAFNNKDFDKYLDYLDMDVDTESGIKERLDAMGKLFDSKYNIENLGYDDNDDGTYNVTIQFLVDVTDLTSKSTSQIREVDIFVVKPSDDSYLISKIVEGESARVTEAVS